MMPLSVELSLREAMPELLFAEFESGLYLATRPVTIRVEPDPEREFYSGGGSPDTVDRRLILNCPCGAELNVSTRINADDGDPRRHTFFGPERASPVTTVLQMQDTEPPCGDWHPMPNVTTMDLDARQQLRDAEARLKLAREALVATGYFTPDQVGDDIAPRITEMASRFSESEEGDT